VFSTLSVRVAPFMTSVLLSHQYSTYKYLVLTMQLSGFGYSRK